MLRRIVVSMFVLLLCPSAIAVCRVPQPRVVCAEYTQTDAVVIARLVRSKHVVPKDEDDYHLYTFAVAHTFRGTIPKTIVLFDENTSARLAFDIVKGRDYLLFLDHWLEKGWWIADGCGNSGPVNSHAHTIKEIDRVGQSRSARITGTVLGQTVGHDLGSRLGGASVEAMRKADGRSFMSRSDADGKFDFRVPPGEYSVQVEANGKSYVNDWLTYEHDDAVNLTHGGCAQIQFVPKESSEAEREQDRARRRASHMQK